MSERRSDGGGLVLLRGREAGSEPGLEDLLPAPVRRLDLARGLGPIAEAGVPSAWYRLFAGELSLLRPAEDPDIALAESLESMGRHAILSYRPRRRLVVRRESLRGVVVEKGYRHRRSGLSAQRHRLAHDALAGSPVRAPRVLDHRRDRDSLVLHCFEGGRPELGAQSTDVFTALGRGLQAMQRFTVGACLPLFRHSDEVEVLDRLAARVLELGLRLPSGWIEQRGRLAERLDRLPSSRPVLCHRDLHDGQIVVAGGRVALLDFDLLCIADSALDPANLLAHLELRALQGVAGRGAETLAVLSSAFLEGLESRESDFGSRLRAYRASSLLRLALVYTLRPPWRGVVPALVHRAERWLGR